MLADQQYSLYCSSRFTLLFHFMDPLYFKADKLKMAKPDRTEHKNQNYNKS